jgi:DNA-binding NtrC family response regulator
MGVQNIEKLRILAVDDDPSFGGSLKMVLSDTYEIQVVHSAAQALQALHSSTFSAGLIDMRMPDISGMELLKLVRGKYPELPVIMLTGDREPRSVVDAMKYGASDYIVKETPELALELKFRLGQAIEKQSLIGRNRKLEAKIAQDAAKYKMIGTSVPMIKLFSQIASVRGSSATVLIFGETGVGKELVARELNLQEDGARPFIEVNCAAIPENLAESELFGHEKGSFTGAIQQQKGKFVLANGGDLFLDEIAELSLSIQAKVLRVIQQREVTSVGGQVPTQLNIRIIAATHKNLLDEVKKGRFREDLYYRLNVIPLTVPPLRERKEDIPLLVNHFLRQLKIPHIQLTKEAMEAVVGNKWTGNIRALSSCIERASITAKAEGKSFIHNEYLVFDNTTLIVGSSLRIPIELLPARSDEVSPARLAAFMEWAEKIYLQAAFSAVSENKSKLAQNLGVSRSYVHYKFKNLGVEDPVIEATSL